MFLTLLIATTEYLLAGLVWFKGRTLPKTFAVLLFFLASYQVGELIAFASDDFSRTGVQIAYFSTTLLPPIGVLILERVTGKNYGYPLFQTVGLFFAIMFLVDPNIIETYTIDEVFIRVESSQQIFWYWAYPYYMSTLALIMLIGLYHIIFNKNIEIKKFMVVFVMAISSFYLVTIFIALLFPSTKSAFASIMCALALTAAFILSWASLHFDPEKLEIKELGLFRGINLKK